MAASGSACTSAPAPHFRRRALASSRQARATGIIGLLFKAARIAPPTIRDDASAAPSPPSRPSTAQCGAKGYLRSRKLLPTTLSFRPAVQVELTDVGTRPAFLATANPGKVPSVRERVYEPNRVVAADTVVHRFRGTGRSRLVVTGDVRHGGILAVQSPRRTPPAEFSHGLLDAGSASQRRASSASGDADSTPHAVSLGWILFHRRVGSMIRRLGTADGACSRR